MRSATRNKSSAVTSGDVFADLAFAPEKAMALRFKATILSAILTEVRQKQYRQSKLVQLLDEHQPVISNLLRGKISQMSIEKLLVYGERLGLQFDVRRSRRTRGRG